MVARFSCRVGAFVADSGDWDGTSSAAVLPCRSMARSISVSLRNTCKGVGKAALAAAAVALFLMGLRGLICCGDCTVEAVPRCSGMPRREWCAVPRGVHTHHDCAEVLPFPARIASTGGNCERREDADGADGFGEGARCEVMFFAAVVPVLASAAGTYSL